MYKLLVVDDENESRNLLCRYFPWDELGFEVVSQLENGKAALKYITENAVDVILCDIRMPFLDGIELAKEIFTRKLKIKVVFLSAYKDFEYAHKAIVYGVYDYIVKPSKYDEISKVFSSLKEMLDNDKVEVNDLNELSDYDSKIISAIKKYVNEKFKDAKLENIADSVHMNPNYLSQFFKQKTGECFSNYLIAVKMKKACELLNDTRYKTYEISDMVGYSNPKNFTRTFKNFYGVSPKDYRNRKLNNNINSIER